MLGFEKRQQLTFHWCGRGEGGGSCYLGGGGVLVVFFSPLYPMLSQCQDPSADLSKACWSQAAGFSERFFPACHFERTIYTDVEWLQVFCWPSWSFWWLLLQSHLCGPWYYPKSAWPYSGCYNVPMVQDMATKWGLYLAWKLARKLKNGWSNCRPSMAPKYCH